MPTILVVDDEPALRMAFDAGLTRAGYRVRTADCAATGLELCERLQADPRFSSIPIFMTSATYVLEKSPPAGVVRFVQKPIKWVALLAQIRSTLTNRSTV